MRDLTKVLSEAEIIKLRQLAAQTPDMPTVAAGAFQEYPKILYHPDYVPLSRVANGHPDPLTRKEALQKMPRVVVVVHDLETEEEYLRDHWKIDPVEIMLEMGEKDPRIPIGREGRLAASQRRQTVAEEVAELRRRYASLTGRSLVDEDHDTDQPAGEATRPENPTERLKPLASRKQQQVKAAAKRASQPAAR